LKKPFNKPAISYEEQVSLLKSRGMIVESEKEAEFHLEHINYYRLAAYWLPFEEDHSTHEFKKGTSFNKVISLYFFDRELRLLFLESIEKIEISIRAHWAHQIANIHGPHAHLNASLAIKNEYWQQNKEALEKEVERSDEIFIKHHRETYLEELPPIWAICEVMSLGLLSKWLSNLKPESTRKAIAKPFGLGEKVFVSWVRHLTAVRNVCAHHSRLWNREFKIRPMPVSNEPSILAGELISASEKIYNTLLILLYLMDIICPGHDWRKQLKKLLNENEDNLKDMGFPDGWQTKPIWRKRK
jgi:abortive infection bacteriophage resistance protein